MKYKNKITTLIWSLLLENKRENPKTTIEIAFAKYEIKIVNKYIKRSTSLLKYANGINSR